MASIRCMAVFQGQSGLPEDRYVNTWHFWSLAPYAGHVTDAVATVETFYNHDTGMTSSIGSWLSPAIDRDWEIRAYDLNDDEPRVPEIFPETLGAPLNASGAPEEVCAVLSFHGAPPVTARRRGRIYVGPLVDSCYTPGDNDQYSSLHTQLTVDLEIAASAALDYSNTNVAGWSIRSTRPSENFVIVVGGWVDNAIDIQRRRGAAATTRDTWP